MAVKRKVEKRSNFEHFIEVELVNRKLDRINREIKSGKRKLLNSEQALGAYAKCLK